MQALLQTIASGLVAVGLAIGNFLMPVAAVPAPILPALQENLGATNELDTLVALFETTLANSITSTATTMTLTSALTKDGTTLASSTYGFVLDEGTASEEFVRADCTATSCTNMQRGLSVITGTTTVSTLQKAHRRGASVKMTTAPSLLQLQRLSQGIANFPAVLRYNNVVTTGQLGLDGQNIASVAYANSLAFGAVPAASETAAGFAELATGCEAASSTSSGTVARLVIPASMGTSTWNSAALAACKVAVANNLGKIPDGFISTSTLFVNSTFSTSTNIGSFPAWEIGKQQWISTTTGTSTFPVPSGINKVMVMLCGSGGGGSYQLGAGAAAGCASKVVNVTGTTSIQVYIGAKGTGAAYGGNATDGAWTTFGTNGFYLSCTGGAKGVSQTSSSGGTCSGADFFIAGQNGDTGLNNSSTFQAGGQGGNSWLGFGGAPVWQSTNGTKDGNVGTGCGSGGGGGANLTSTGQSGGNATDGCIIVRW